MKFEKVIRALKYLVFIPRKISRKPSSPHASISDLFPIRNDNEWKTFFELLNIPNLISGETSLDKIGPAKFVFFSKDGDFLGDRNVSYSKFGRKSIAIQDFLLGKLKEAKTFSVFHDIESIELDIGTSVLAERGYCGFASTNSSIRGYVHGNLDAIAQVGESLEMLGNKGLLSRVYQIQHPLRGPALYEFFISNPCKRAVKIKLEERVGREWRFRHSIKLNPRGSHIFSIVKTENQESFVRIRSKLYLGRPVVFRSQGDGIDVFHG